MTFFDIAHIGYILTGILCFILMLVVYFNNRKNIINQIFALEIFSAFAWIFTVLMADTSTVYFWALFWSRFAIMGPALVPFFFLLFAYVFPVGNLPKPSRIILYFIPALLFIILAPTSLNVKSVEIKDYGAYLNTGILYPILFFYLIIYVGFGFYLLIKKYKKIEIVHRKQINYILIGYSLSLSISTLTSLILVAIGRSEYSIFGPTSTIFFVVLTSFAIIKYHLFNIKVIAAEIFTFAISATLFIKIFLSDNTSDLIINIGIFVFVAGFGLLLIRSVIKEVQQKEKIDAIRVEDEAVLTSIGDGVIAINKEGKIMFINRMAQELLLINPEDAINKPYEEILKIENEKGDATPKEKNPLYDALAFGKKTITDATGGLHNIMYYFVRTDKTKFPAAVTVAPVILEGKIIGAVDVFRDITIERQIDRSKSEFVSLASHQLRTPLTAIKWYSDVLFKEKLSEKIKKLLTVISDSNERMIRLIDIMLNISRFEAGKIKLNPSPTNIKKLLEEIIKEQKFEIERKKENFIFECPNDLREILIDQNLFKLVFQNVISNAIKYTFDKGTVSFKVAKKDDILYFEIADTGIGIPENQQKRIFEKLFRADNAFTHEPEGNGLGMYAAKMTTENLGGKIWFKSKVGQGTTFFITLPITKS